MADMINKQNDMAQTTTGQNDIEMNGAGRNDIELNGNRQNDIGLNGTGQNDIEINNGQAIGGKPQLHGFDKRFMLYDRIKLKLRTLDTIIIIAVILLFVTFFLGVYKR